MVSVGGADFDVRANLSPLSSGMQQGEQVARAGAAKISGAISQELKKAEDAAKRTGEGLKRAFEIGGAIAGVSLSIEGVRAALGKVIEVTKEAETVQTALNRTYGAGAAQFNKFAAEQAKATGQSALEFQKASAEAKSLATNYGLTNAQIQELIKRSADLATVNGTTTSDAFHRVEAALQGEAKSAEALGLSLNSNAVKAFANLTEEQRKNFDTLDQVTKAQIIYNELMRQSAQDAGAAEKGAGELTVALNKLDAAGASLSREFGQTLTPAIVGVATVLTELAHLLDGIPTKIAAAIAAQIAGARAIAAVITGNRQAALEAEEALKRAAQQATGGAAEEPGLGPSPNEVAAAQEAQRIQAALDLARREAEKRAAKEELEQRKKDAQDRVDVEVAGLEKEKQARERAFADERAQLEHRKEGELRDAQDRHEATIRAIEAEAQATARGFDQQIALAQQARDKQKQASQDARDEQLRAIDAESKAVKAASDEAIRQAEIQRDARKRAAEDVRDAALKALDDEKRARDDSRVVEDRQLADETEQVKRAISERHQAAVRGLEDEAKKANEVKDRKVRALDDEGKKAQEVHDKRVRALEDEGKQAQAVHEATIATIQGEGDAAQKAHDERIRAISEELDAAQKAHDATLRTLQGQGQAAENAHDVRVRQIADELRVAQNAHDTRERQLNDELAAARDAHDVRTRQADDELMAAQAAHDVTLRALQAEADAEDDRHRAALRAIDEEHRARQAAIDAQINQLDALDKASQQASQAQQLQDRLASAQTGVKKAESTGNQSEIDAANRALVEAQQAILDQESRNERDAARDRLKTQKDALDDEIRSRQDSENEKDRLRKQELDAEKQAADDTLKLIQGRVASEKQAADDELKLIQDRIAAEKQAADDALALLKTRLDAEKQAADDELALIKQRLDAEKQAADDELKLIQERVASERQAADDALKARLEELAHAREIADELLKTTQNRLAAEKQAEDDALAGTKASLDKRKQAIDDATRHALDKIDERKRAEQDSHDNEVTLAQDAAEQAKRAVQDRRRAEDEADQDKRRAIAETFKAEQDAIRATYDDEATGVIPAIRRATQAAQDGYEQRRQIVNDAYTAEQRRLAELYDDPVSGIIVRLRDQASEAAATYAVRKQVADDAYQTEQRAIQATYDGPGGLFDKLDKAKQATIDSLNAQIEEWRNWKKEVIKEIDEALNHLDAFLEKRARGINATGGAAGMGTPGEPGTSPSAGPGSSNDVKAWIEQAMQIAGVGGDWEEGLLRLVSWESSGNPSNVNATAVIDPKTGANLGHATGLLQTLPGTFAANRDPSLPNNIKDPVANAVAAINYIRKTYRHVNRIPGIASNNHAIFPGYASGTVIRRPTWLVDAPTGRPVGMAGENYRPERLLGERATASYEAVMPSMLAGLTAGGDGGSYGAAASLAAGAGRETMAVNVMLGNDVIKTVWISGYKLLQSASGLPRSFGSPA